MIRQIFTWWNSQTVGTFLYTIFFGKLVGRDEFGNKYYQNKTVNTIPTEKKIEKYSWQKPHKDNKTGSIESYKPNKISKKGKDFKKYESWKP